MEVRCFLFGELSAHLFHFLLIIRDHYVRRYSFFPLKLKARAPFTVHILKSYFFSLPEAKYIQCDDEGKSLISGFFLEHETIVARALEFLMKQLSRAFCLLETK